MHDLRIKIHANRTNQEAGINEFYSLVCLVESLQITVALAAAFRSQLSLIDVVNAHQNAILSPKQMSYVHLSLFYIK